MHQLTFILTLKDRVEYSRSWLKSNLHPDYFYYVADGSLGDENSVLFSSLNYPNLKYVRYPKDLSVQDYLAKILDSLKHIQTEYVMFCDNDDFINFNGVLACISALDSNHRATFSGGSLFAIFQNSYASGRDLYSLPFRVVKSSRPLTGLGGFNAIKIMFNNYCHVWYSVFRTKAAIEIWGDITNLQINDLYLIELLHVELAFCYGSYIEVRANHYVRLVNPSSSQAKTCSETDIPHTQKIFFDDEYRAQVLRASSHVANLLKVDLKEFLGELKFFYIGKRMIPKFCEIISLQIRSRLVAHLPYFKLSTIFAIINIFQRRA